MSVAEQVELLFREKRGKEVERDTVPDEFRSASVDELDPYEREVLVSSLRRTDLPGNCISCLESMLLYLILRYIDVVRRVKIIIV